MLNKSIAYRLSIYISLAVITVFIVFIGIYFLFNQKIIQENVQNRAIGLSSTVIGNVRKHVVATKEVAENVSEQIYYYLEHDHAEEFITTLLEKYEFLNAIHVNIDEPAVAMKYHHLYAYTSRDTVRIHKGTKRFNTCFSRKKEFQQLVIDGVKDWSEPLLCERNNNVVVSFLSPIMQTTPKGEKKKVGEVICELSLYELNESINKIEIGKEGYAFLITRKGNFITHPNEDYILKRSVFDLPEKTYNKRKLDLKEVLSKGLTGSVIAYPEHLNFERAWVYYTPILDTNWMLVFVEPYKELFEPLYLPLLQMLFFSVLGILVIYLLITYITNKQIEPLTSITSQLKKFSSAGSEITGNSENEIRQVSDSLNILKAWQEKQRLSQDEQQKQSKKRSRDIKQAAEIQQSFIRTDFPAFPERKDVDLYACYRPAKGVSGDLYDYFFIDDEHLVFTIGDVSGKGIPAAFFMSVAQTIIKSCATKISAKEIVMAANTELYTNNQHQFFLTLFLGVLNVKTGSLLYCNAAHTAPYILKSDGSITELAQSHGLPLGLYSDKMYEEAEIQIQKGDIIVLYTDGVNELQDENGIQYGAGRLEENLRNLVGLNPQEVVFKVEKSLDVFLGETKQIDDISILVLSYKA